MNWFERYYISGAYFVSLVLIWLYVLTPNSSIWCDSERLTGLIALIAFIALPVGYVLTNLTHYLYGSQVIRWPFPIFSKILKNLNLSETLLGKADEFIIEAELSIPGRFTCINEEVKNGDKNIDRIKWLSEMMTKRFAVLAISNNFILATPLAIVLSVIISGINSFYWPIDFKSWLNCISSVQVIQSIGSAITLLLICALVCIILYLTNKRLAEQIIVLHTKMIEKTSAFEAELKKIAEEYGVKK